MGQIYLMSIFFCIVFPRLADSSLRPWSLDVQSQTRSGLEVVFSLHEMLIEEMVLDGEAMQSYGLASVYVPQAGAPSLGGATRYVAVPQGARVEVVLLNSRIEVFQGVEVLPAPNLPLETDDAPLRYEKDMAIYGRDAYFPSSPVLVSAPMQIRGVDVVIVNVTPYQYNPVSKELIVYKDLRFRLDYVGGNGRFGDDRLRSRFWEPVLAGHLLNYTSLPPVDFYAPERIQARDGWEYVIIIPDDPVFEAWADTIKAWRKLQGISCEVFTTTEIGGNSVTAIENFLNNAYNTWEPAPAAFLILSDYPSSGDVYGVTAPVWNGYCVSDNVYADVDGDNLPDMHHGRICAQTASQLSFMVSKFLHYERDPYEAANFYDEPLIVAAWSGNSWLQLSAEILRGFFDEGLFKDPVRQYAIQSGTVSPGCPWSNAPNTSSVVQYFYGLGWLPDTLNPYDSNYWNNGSAAGINAAINSGAFFVQHRSIGSETTWLYPTYTISDIYGLSDNPLSFVNSTNSLTGKFNWFEECFVERFHRISHGALGLNAATEVGYSFVTDIYLWGMIDGMWPQFMPDYPGPRMSGCDDLRPCMAMTAGKYYLALPGWPYVPQQKAYVYHLFLHHGDVFTTLFSEMPQYLTVVHDTLLPAGQSFFPVCADDSSVIALTVDNEIIGVASGTGLPVNIDIEPQIAGTTMKATVTKADHYRYDVDVPVVEVGVAGDGRIGQVGAALVLEQLSPNPFQSSTRINYGLPQATRTAIMIFDALGRRIVELSDEIQQPGWHALDWNGMDADGRRVPAGIYFCGLRTEGASIVRKIVLLR